MSADFIERRKIIDWSDANAALRDAVEAAKKRGATYCRAHVRTLTNTVIVEGWRVQPRDQGDLPL